MNSFEFKCETRIIFGAGTERRVGREIKKCGGRRVLIVYGGGSVKRSGLLSRVE